MRLKCFPCLYAHILKVNDQNTSDALPFVRERLGAGQILTAPDKLGWNNLGGDECGPKTHEWRQGLRSMIPIPETGS